MTLPTTGAMTAAMINVELGRASNAAFNINGAAERALAGKPSGAISFADFRGKSSYTAPTWSLAAGTHSVSGSLNASIDIVASKSVTWTWSKSGAHPNQVAVSLASGASGTSITLEINARNSGIPDVYLDATCTVSLTATDGTTSRSWTINMTAWGNG